MTRLDDAILATQGPITVTPSYSSSATLGTTASLVRAAGTDSHAHLKVVRVSVENLSSSANIAVGHASGIKADPSDANCAKIIQPNQGHEFSFRSTLDLYVVADAASTSYNVTYDVVGG